MKKLMLAVYILFACLFAPIQVSAGEMQKPVDLAALTESAQASGRIFSKKSVEVAQQTCSTTCNGSNYSNSCSSGQSCDCSCSRQPVCQCR